MGSLSHSLGDEQLSVLHSLYTTLGVTQVEAWEKRLSLLSETLDEWVTVQRNWMYLETIFCAEDIQKQLPDEASKFQTVDRMWKVGPLL